MIQNPSSQTATISLPADAEQVRTFSGGQVFYVLPKNDKRRFPINVFIGSDMHRESVDHWYECIVEVYMKCTDPAIFILHDMRDPRIHFTSYSTAKIRALSKLRPELGGGNAVLFKAEQSFFRSLIQSVLQSLPVSRSTHLFYDYNKAQDWLLNRMEEDE